MEKLVKQVLKRPTPLLFNWPQNWVLKLMSLFFAIFLWYFVVGEDKVDTNVNIPVEIVNLPRDLVISNQYKKQVEVTLSGPRGLINGLERQHVSRSINLSKASAGTVVIRNELDSIKFPRGILVQNIRPTHITLRLDRLIEKELNVQATLIGKPAKGYEVTGVVFDPPFITVSGPKATLNKESQLATQPLDINGLKTSLNTQIALDLNPEILDLIGETVVTATVIIKEKVVEKNVRKIPVKVLSVAGKKRLIRMSPITVGVRVSMPLSFAGSKKKIADLVQARIWLDTLPAGKHEVKVEASASDPVSIVEVTPATIAVELKQAAPSKK